MQTSPETSPMKKTAWRPLKFLTPCPWMLRPFWGSAHLVSTWPNKFIIFFTHFRLVHTFFGDPNRNLGSRASSRYKISYKYQKERNMGCIFQFTINIKALLKIGMGLKAFGLLIYLLICLLIYLCIFILLLSLSNSLTNKLTNSFSGLDLLQLDMTNTVQMLAKLCLLSTEGQ